MFFLIRRICAAWYFALAVACLLTPTGVALVVAGHSMPDYRRIAAGTPVAIWNARRCRVVPEQDRDRWRFASDGPYAADCSSQRERGAALLKISSRAYREY